MTRSSGSGTVSFGRAGPRGGFAGALGERGWGAGRGGKRPAGAPGAAPAGGAAGAGWAARLGVCGAFSLSFRVAAHPPAPFSALAFPVRQAADSGPPREGSGPTPSYWAEREGGFVLASVIPRGGRRGSAPERGLPSARGRRKRAETRLLSGPRAGCAKPVCEGASGEDPEGTARSWTGRGGGRGGSAVRSSFFSPIK